MITLTEFDESDATIRSQLPSYTRLAKKTSLYRSNGYQFIKEQKSLAFHYQFDGQQFSVLTDDESVKTSDNPRGLYATVKAEDIVPSPKEGFNLYLLVGQDNSVLAKRGDSSALSIVNVDHISQLIAKNQQLNWAAITADNNAKDQDKSQKLPGFSNYLDLTLTSSEYRLFIYPFQLSNDIEFTLGSQTGKSQLYMLGVLPKSSLDAQENQRWNLSLLSLSLVVLLFAWMMLRLFMLSNNQPVGDLFYRCTMICSYLLFVMTVALLLAYGEKTIEQNFKSAQADKLMQRINYQLDQELAAIVGNLQPYQEYFHSLVKAIKNHSSGHGQQLASLVLQQDNPAKKHPRITVFSTDNGIFKVDNKTALEKSIQKHDSWPLSFINLFGQGMHAEGGQNNFAEWYEPNEGFNPSSKILNVLVLDKDGINHLPMFHYMESNKAPTDYHLSHRQYFKDVRDQRGWHARFGCVLPPKSIKMEKPATDTTPCMDLQGIDNIYIQRLRNINNGLRGTTMSLPLFTDASERENYIMVADLALASLTMTEFHNSDELLDMTFMVVDRDSGEVLFHLDDDRTLIENLFSSGQGTEDIGHRIRAGLNGRPGQAPEWTDGYYHGTAGQFTFSKLVIDQWALVVFMPDESTDSYMTNLFLLIFITLAAFIIAAAFAIVMLRRSCDTGLLKQRLGIPLVIERRKLMVFTSVYISSLYLGFWLGAALERSAATFQGATYWLSFATAILCLIWGYYEYSRFYRLSRQAQRAPINIRRGALCLTTSYLIAGCLIVLYLHQVAMASASGLNWYYTQKLYPARLNQENQELRKLALVRFPNSVADKQISPLSLLPISLDWMKKLDLNNTSNRYTQPKDVMYFSKLVNTTDLQSWVARYLAGEAKSPGELHRDIEPGFLLLWQTLSFIVLCIVWILFNRRILAVRLFGSPQFLRHLNQIVNRSLPVNAYSPHPDLQIDLTDCPELGLDLALSIQQWRSKTQPLPEALNNLFALCPIMADIAMMQNPLPNMKISLLNYNGKLALHLWDIEVSLEDPEQRALLLRLLNQLKSLKIAGHLASISLYCGFHSFQRLCLKDTMLGLPQEHQTHIHLEYYSWAECLMDFNVKVPEDLQEHLDLEFIHHEIDAFPLLQFLRKELPKLSHRPLSHFNLMRWVYLKDWQKNHAEWASINYLLLKVEALYRFKWESCSAAEKLALYYLVQNKRINPANVQMLEHLALNGLIKVKRGRIHIVNLSFAYFIKYAETEETLEKLVEQGNIGNWQDYRMPITLLILLVIGTIAITSGNSLYMIVASVMGVLGTIGSMTNSANLIRNNLQK